MALWLLDYNLGYLGESAHEYKCCTWLTSKWGVGYLVSLFDVFERVAS
jgi:predicted 3-demethylubiquinone-9 3-methyltransferase (glyoxalase superfamily)